MNEKISNNNVINMVHENIVPLLKNIYDDRVAIAITDTERILFYQPGKDIKMNGHVGDNITNTPGISDCLKIGKNISRLCNTEDDIKNFGTEFKGYLNPIKDNGQVVGVMCFSVSLKKEKNMDEAINDLVKCVNQVSWGVNEINKGFHNMNGMTSNLMSDINAANENAKNSNEIVGIIQGISKQTNLLGLNASIEAARAGEFGKGFTVVAQEIRKLSQSSKESIDKIDGIIKIMADSISNINESLSSAGGVSKSQLSAMGEIVEATNELTLIAEKLKNLSKEF